MLDSGVRLAQVLDWLTLAVVASVAVVVPALIARDARRRGASYTRALGWALLALLLLPIGVGLYLLVTRLPDRGRRP